MPLKCPKVKLRGQKPQNFNPKSVIKFRKVLQTLHFSVKICILVYVLVCSILKTSITAFIFDLLPILCQKSNFQQFLDLLLTLRPLYNIKKVLVIAKNLPKTSINFYYWKIQLFPTCDAEMLLKCSKVVNFRGKT